LQIREDPADDYELFYDQIEGFNFEPGFEYELRVLREPVADPPADGSAFRYSLVEEVNRSPTATIGLEDAIWQADSYVDDSGAMTDVLPEAIPNIEFNAGQATGSTGCNQFQSSYQQDGNSLQIEPGAVTQRACAEPVMNQERAFLDALANTAGYTISGNTLEFQNADSAPLIIFNRLAPTMLTGTTWLLSAYNNGQQAVVSLIAGTEITAVFDANGQLAGSASCNAYRGSYQVDDEQMSIGPLATTRRACADPQGILDQELAYLAALQRTSRFEIRGDQLALRDAEGALQASYIAHGPAATPGDDLPTPAPTAAGEQDAPITDLGGTVWQWQSFQSMDGSDTSVNDPSRYTLEFLPDGRLAIGADCNRATGQYNREGSGLTIALGPSTLAACPDDSQADDFLRYLEDVASFVIEDNTLYLNLRVDAGTMVFTPAGS
jgi:heat shock protein HslJ